MLNSSRMRFPLMLIALLAVLAAMWAGLQRLAWALPSLTPGLVTQHGPLMVGGFLGTLVSLERAVALGRPWTYLAPVSAALGAIAFLVGAPPVLGALLLVVSGAGLIGVFILILRRQPTLFNAVMLVGAVAWAIGNVLMLAGQAISILVYWWMAFLVLTVVGERLELSRLLRLRAVDRGLFLAALALFGAGVVVTVIAPDAGVRTAGAGMLGLALWLLRYDIARRTVRRGPHGLTRYIAACMLAGYGWLAIGGLLALLFGLQSGGPRYDAILHSVFLGFIFSMIFGHSPIILPAVLKVPVPFRPALYLPVALLHLSLALRVASDLLGLFTVRQWGGMLNVVAILAFLSLIAWGALSARRAVQEVAA
ncbi:MAG TPA: hypothetical protein VGA61_14400 [Anaerolineae bacterium]